MRGKRRADLRILPRVQRRISGQGWFADSRGRRLRRRKWLRSRLRSQVGPNDFHRSASRVARAQDGIVDASMHHGGKHMQERIRDGFDVTERQVALVELMILHLLPYQIVYQVLEALRCGTVQAAGGGFDRIGQHNDSCLAGLGLGARIAETLLEAGRRFASGCVVHQRLMIKIADQGRAVMLGDDADDVLGQTMLSRHLHAIAHMRRDNQGRQRRTEPGMYILPPLVLDEEFGVFHLADVVMVTGDTA